MKIQVVTYNLHGFIIVYEYFSSFCTLLIYNFVLIYISKKKKNIGVDKAKFNFFYVITYILLYTLLIYFIKRVMIHS